ncbi:nuclear transport factor 2 family protein [Thermoflexibacter ruber]|uniref:Putative lumazine-binding n=1 Tax=Thermoflexibacter ruber TaxID=1003 RepID=A0A1I2JYC5_9BACT|nr:nuclear transport factor 2 family protein [Thermoflexibacter ruber]SFF57766.1 Putative lumazine-binding [Thermoflexibacter ruber]
MEARETLIKKYVESYNSFDTEKMTEGFSDDIVFVNIQNGQVTMTLNGINEFKNQAETAKQFFSQRIQKILSFNHEGHITQIEIDYQGVLAQDFPNGLKKGQEIKLKGKSTFEFKDGKVIKLTDES